jgi:tape measure domain-containing protein
MAEERVVLTAELKDQMSAPLETAAKRVEGFTRTVETGTKRQAAATERSTTAVTGALGKQNRLFAGMTGTIGRATDGAARMFSGMRSRISNSLNGLAGEATKQGERAGNGFADGLKKATALVATYFGAQMVGGFVKDAAAASDATDKFKSTMSFAGLDTSAIVRATADAKAFADQTVYDLPTVQATMAQLASNGVKSYTDITKAAGNLNAVAGGNAETFKSVSRTLTQSAGAGKLMTEDWNMLADAIPGASGPLQAAMKEAGAFEGNFKKAMEQGEISSEEFQAAITKLGNQPIAVEAAKSTKTFEGAIGNLQATINSKLMTALDKIKPAATAAIGALTNGLGKALDWTGDAAQGLYDLLVKGDYQGALQRAFGWEEDSKAIDMLLKMRDVAIELPGKLKAVADKVWEFREPIGIVAGLIVTLLIPYWIRLGYIALVSAGQQKLAWAMTQGAALKASYVSMWAFAVMIGGWVLAGTQATIQAVKIAAAWLVALGPVGWIIAGIGLLVAGVIWAYNNIGWFKDGVDAAFRWISDVVKIAVDWIVGAFNNLVSFWNTDVMPGLDALGKFFSDTFTNIGNWARDFVGFFVDGWGMIVDFFNGVLMPAVQAVGAFFAPILDWIGRLIWNFATIAVFVFMRIVDLWNGVLLPALQNLGNWFMSILNWIYATVIQPVVNLVVGAFRGIVDFWNGVLVPGAQALGNWFMTILNWIYATIIQPVINLIVGAFRGIVDFWNLVLIPAFQAVGNWFQSIFTWIYDVIIKPYIDLLVGAFGMLTDFWNNTLKPVIDTVGQWFSEIIGGAINGVKGFIDDLVKAFQTLMTFIGDKLQPVIDGIKGTFETLGKIIGDVLGKIGQFANNPLGGLQDMLGIKKDANGQGIMPQNSGGGVYSGGGVVEAAFAGGGVLGGYSPGNDSILASLSPGESVLVPELTRAIGPQNIMAANAAASGGRPAGSGPSMTSGYSSAGRGGGSTLTIQAPVQITVQGGADGVDYAALKAAVNDAFEDLISEHNRRAY